MAKKEKEQLERRLDRLLAEKMELEYRFQELESVYAHEKGQREEILRLHENTRRLKHDMKNHIMVITSYLQENRIEEARHYLSRVLDELNQIYTYVETGNSVMNYVLNQKLEKAYRKGNSDKGGNRKSLIRGDGECGFCVAVVESSGQCH